MPDFVISVPWPIGFSVQSQWLTRFAPLLSRPITSFFTQCANCQHPISPRISRYDSFFFSEHLIYGLPWINLVVMSAVYYVDYYRRHIHLRHILICLRDCLKTAFSWACQSARNCAERRGAACFAPPVRVAMTNATKWRMFSTCLRDVQTSLFVRYMSWISAYLS